MNTFNKIGLVALATLCVVNVASAMHLNLKEDQHPSLAQGYLTEKGLRRGCKAESPYSTANVADKPKVGKARRFKIDAPGIDNLDTVNNDTVHEIDAPGIANNDTVNNDAVVEAGYSWQAIAVRSFLALCALGTVAKLAAPYFLGQ